MDITTLKLIDNLDFLGRSKTNLIRGYFRNLDDEKFKEKIIVTSKAAIGFVKMQVISDEQFNSIDEDGWNSIMESYVSWKFHRFIDEEDLAAESKYEITTVINNLNNKTEFEAEKTRKDAESQRKTATGSVYFF